MRKKIYITIATVLMACTLFGCASKTETTAKAEAKKTNISEEDVKKDEVQKEEQKTEKTQVKEEKTEEAAKTKNEVKNETKDINEFYFKVADSDMIKLPITLSELYDKGFTVLYEGNEVNLEEILKKKKYIECDLLYSGNYVGKCLLDKPEDVDLDTGTEYKNFIAARVIISDTSDVIFMDNFQIGVSTKDDFINTFGRPDTVSGNEINHFVIYKGDGLEVTVRFGSGTSILSSIEYLCRK